MSAYDELSPREKSRIDKLESALRAYRDGEGVAPRYSAKIEGMLARLEMAKNTNRDYLRDTVIDITEKL